MVCSPSPCSVVDNVVVFVSHRVKECCFITSGWRCTASHSCSAARTSTAPPTPTTHQRMHAGCNSRGVYAEGLVHTPQTRVAASDTHATAPLAFAAISPPASAPAPAGAPTPAPRDVAGWQIRPSTTGCRTKRSTLLPFLRAAALANFFTALEGGTKPFTAPVVQCERQVRESTCANGTKGLLHCRIVPMRRK